MGGECSHGLMADDMRDSINKGSNMVLESTKTKTAIPHTVNGLTATCAGQIKS